MEIERANNRSTKSHFPSSQDLFLLVLIFAVVAEVMFISYGYFRLRLRLCVKCNQIGSFHCVLYNYTEKWDCKSFCFALFWIIWIKKILGKGCFPFFIHSINKITEFLKDFRATRKLFVKILFFLFSTKKAIYQNHTASRQRYW